MDIGATMRKRAVAISLASLLPFAGVNAACLGMQVHAHRGAPGQGENSLASMRGAYAGHWDGVEVDLQRLGDGKWVLHHDMRAGRTVQGVARVPVSQLDSIAWERAKVVGTGEAAPFLAGAMREAAGHADKTFNAELKVIYASCEPVRQLVGDMKQAIGHGNWMLTSAFPEALSCIRIADPDGYLGLIVLDPRHAEAAGVNPVSSYVARRGRAPVLSAQWLDQLIDRVGMPVGVHLDALTLAANPSLLAEAAKRAVPVFVYAVQGDTALVRHLQAENRRSGYLPSGVVIDGAPDEFCRALESGR